MLVHSVIGNAISQRFGALNVVSVRNQSKIDVFEGVKRKQRHLQEERIHTEQWMKRRKGDAREDVTDERDDTDSNKCENGLVTSD